MYVIEPGAESWRQVAAVVASELGRLEVVRLVVHAKSEAMIPEYLQASHGVLFVCNEQHRADWAAAWPQAEFVGRPVKPTPPEPPSPIPPELLKVSSEMLTPGLKDCLHTARQALLNEAVPAGKPILCVGGPADELDTAAVIVPGLRADHADAHILETICAPYET